MGPLLYAARKRAAAAAGSPASDAATSASDTPLRSIDIGCGIGSVVLMTAWLYPGAQCFGVEAQPTRFSQAVRSVAYNGVGERVTLVNGDLRDPSVAPSKSFDLVTGAQAVLPTHATLLLIASLVCRDTSLLRRHDGRDA